MLVIILEHKSNLTSLENFYREELVVMNKTFGDLINFRRDLWQDDNLYTTYSLEEIAKLFIKNFLDDEDIFTKYTFEEIRLKYIDILEPKTRKIKIPLKNKEVNLPPIPEKEKDFFAYICRTQIDLRKEPRICLLAIYQNVSEDLYEIEERIVTYQEKLENLQKKENNNCYELQILRHFINLNIEAKNEIINFISSERIKSCALEQARGGLIEQFNPALNLFRENIYTYSYRYHPSRYDADNLSHIANKFLDITLPEMHKLEQLYKDSPLDFYEYTHKYIAENKIIDQIKQYGEENHFLNARLNLIQPALDSYYTNKVLFINLIPLQIEGIFYDYCIGLGIPEESLQKASIGEKLDKIIAINPNLYDFEYFKFIFPQTRNRVAHGKLFSTKESDHISCLLLLDLYHVCGHITSEDIPVNLMVNLLKKIKNRHFTNGDLLRVKYGLLEKIEYYPKFYNLEGVIDLVEDKCKEDIFFNYLGEVIRESTNDPVIIKAMKKILSSYKNNKIQIDKCIELFKEIQKIDLPNNKNVIKEGFIDFCAAFRVNGVI